MYKLQENVWYQLIISDIKLRYFCTWSALSSLFTVVCFSEHRPSDFCIFYLRTPSERTSWMSRIIFYNRPPSPVTWPYVKHTYTYLLYVRMHVCWVYNFYVASSLFPIADVTQDTQGCHAISSTLTPSCTTYCGKIFVCNTFLYCHRFYF